MLGVFKDLSSDVYHSDITSVSRSGLWEFKKAPLKYWNAYLNPNRPPREDTPDLAFGRAFHTYVLEPEKFDQLYVVKRMPVLLKESGREAYEEYKKYVIEVENAGKTILTAEQLEQLKNMRGSVLSHPEASQLIVGGAIEHSLFWVDPHTGVLCKCRPDVWHDNMTVDLKSCKSASEYSFIKSVGEYGYHLQSAMMREGIYRTGGNDIRTHAFINVEKKWPHLVSVYYFHQSVLDSAHNMFKNTLKDFKECLQTDVWPGLQTREITLPSWIE